MSYSVSDAKSELEGMLHGTTLDSITNVNGVFNRAARQFLLDCDAQETKVLEQLGVIYEGVYDYACPTNLKGDKIIDIRPQVNREVYDRYSQVYNQDFDVFKDISINRKFTVQWNNYVRTLRLDSFNLNKSININNGDSISGNGTWAVSGTASNLVLDTVNTVFSGGNIAFDLATGTGGVVNSTMTAVDLTSHLNQSKIFFKVYLPVASAFTSVTIKFGSSASAYWSTTVTTDWNGNALVNGYNLLAGTWASKTGSPDVSKINYVSVSFVYGGTSTSDVQVAEVVSRLGTIVEIEYYAKDMFRDASTGAFKEKTTDDSDLINLDTDALNIYIFLVNFYCVQQALGQNSNFDASIFIDQYQNDLARYKRMYKSESVHPQTRYYTPAQRGYGQYLGRQINY